MTSDDGRGRGRAGRPAGIAYTLEPLLLGTGSLRHPSAGSSDTIRSNPSTTGRGAVACIGSPDRGHRSPSGMEWRARAFLYVTGVQVPQPHSKAFVSSLQVKTTSPDFGQAIVPPGAGCSKRGLVRRQTQRDGVQTKET
ncbi:hypothetical protein GCM10010302_10870 [Streptomyces polychromogenes]|uniref:Uncharacterized protein n=1 Tax=Streptomyces polychromogenes TaxID=67342 RepID=A0ABN0V4Q6_9ACTN